jgi:hypothetical protein
LFTGVALLAFTKAYTSNLGPDTANTGAPGETTCAQSACHGQFAPTLGNNSVATIEGLPAGYVPGATYELTARVSSASVTSFTQKRGGFQLTAKKADKSRGGQLVVGPGTKFNPASAPATRAQYLEHTEGKPGSDVTWTFQWTAPAAGSGPVTFYIAGKSANNDGDTTGDRIFTNAYPVPEASVQLPCVGDLDGNKAVDDGDAVLVLQEIVFGGILTAGQRALADVTGDTVVDVSDAVKILQVKAGTDTSLPAVCPP